LLVWRRGVDQDLYFFKDIVGQLVALMAEKLDTVVLGRIMRS
jgi:hypothetical protein